MMISITQKNKMKKAYKKITGLMFWLIVWLIASIIIDKELILPTPFAVLEHLFVLVRDGSFWLKCLFSLARILGGFFLGHFLGIVLAVAAKKSEIAQTIISSFIGAIKTIPVASFIILVMLWIKTDYVPLYIASLMVLPVIYENTAAGIENVDEKMLEVGKVFHFSKWKMFRYIYLPSVAPYVGTAAITALGLAWKSGIAAEVIALPKKAVGLEIYNAKIYLETADLFAWTLVIVLLSFLLEMLLRKHIERRKERGEILWK